MSIVSISEAARLTRRARSTIQAYIKAGKISKTTDHHTGNTGIETSELIRVFGYINTNNTTDTTCSENIEISQKTTAHTTDSSINKNLEILQLKSENERLKVVLEAKQETIDTLKSALKLLEYHQNKKGNIIFKKDEKILSESSENIFKNPIDIIDYRMGFWNRLKKFLTN